MKVGIVQLPSIGMSSTKFYKFVRIAQKKGVRVLLLGEYVLSSFFKELQEMPLSMIKEQSTHQLKMIKELSKTYNMTIVAPLIVVKKKKIYKTVVKVSPNSIQYYDQQILINYPHWNEEKFFDNEVKTLHSPLIFKIEEIKFAVLSGFELHFDALFEEISNKKVDVVLLPSVSTFESRKRWKELAKSRAFTHSTYILRANRIGEYVEKKDIVWNFYGDSFAINPYGEVEDDLLDSEELMIVEIDRKQTKDARRLWGFNEAINRRKDV